MPDFTFWLANIDWTTPLVLLMIGSLLFFIFAAAFLTWLESFRQYVQSEAERETQLKATKPFHLKHHKRGWRIHHI
jgi:hypothetical protein